MASSTPSYPLTDLRQGVHRLPAGAERLAQVRLHLLGGAQGDLLDRGHRPCRERLEDLVVEQRQIAQDRRHRALRLLGRAMGRLADHALGRGRDLDGEVALALGPAAGPRERVDRLVEVAVRQVALALGVDGVLHVHHVGVEQQSERGLGFVCVDEVGVQLAALFLGAEELAHGPVPVDDAEDPGQLVALLELLDRRLEHPQVTVVVDVDLLPESVVPEPQHDVHEQLSGDVLTNDDGAWHAHVVVGVGAVVEGRQRQVDRRAARGGEASQALQNLARVQGVRGTRQVPTVQFGATDGHEDDVVFAPVGLHLVAHRGLNVRPRCPPLAW
jgi:hypothetical protein